MEDENGDIVEPFCGACIAAPLALMGVGASAYGAKGNSHKAYKKVLLITGIITIVASVAVLVYYLFIKKCKGCR